MCRSLCSPNSWWRWSLCWVRCLCPWSWTTWAASTRLKAWRARPMPRCAGCSTAATPGSSSPAPICVHRWAALPMPTRCRWAAIWCAPRPSAWSGAATGRTPPRRRAPSTMPTWWTCCRPGRARTRPWTASWWTTPQGCMASTARPDTPRKTDAMFLLQAPQVCELESFTTMPDALRHPERSDWADANRSGAVTDSFLEGPVFDAAGHLYVADIPWGRVFRIDPQGAWTLVAEYDGEPNGMKFLDERTLLITYYKNGLMRLEVATGRISPYLQRRNSERFKGVNDLVFDAEGNLYFTDQGQSGLHDPSGRLYRLRPDGRLDLLLANVPSPNGVALSPDGRVLYLAVTRGNCVWRVPLLPDGSVAKVGQFFTSYGPSGPDGLAVDDQGRLLVANPGLGLVWVLNHRAEPVQVLRGVPGSSLTNLAFGGADRRTLYVTDSTHGRILRARLEAPGLALHGLNKG